MEQVKRVHSQQFTGWCFGHSWTMMLLRQMSKYPVQLCNYNKLSGNKLTVADSAICDVFSKNLKMSCLHVHSNCNIFICFIFFISPVTSLLYLFWFIAGRNGLVVSASDCGVKGPGFKSHRGWLCLSRQPLRYTALGKGCAPLLQCRGRLSLLPSVG